MAAAAAPSDPRLDPHHMGQICALGSRICSHGASAQWRPGCSGGASRGLMRWVVVAAAAIAARQGRGAGGVCDRDQWGMATAAPTAGGG